MRLRFWLVAAASVPAACVVYTPDLVEGPAPQTSSSDAASSSSSASSGPSSSSSGPASSSASGHSSSSGSSGSGGDPCPGGGCACDDGIQGGDETDVDCGGSCPTKCSDGDGCVVAEDCESGACDVVCQAASCTDKVKNGSETDVDCGGTCPTSCVDGAGCAKGVDCESLVCKNAKCQEPACGDGVVNGGEVCDDGNVAPYDACSCTCKKPVGHLLLTEIAVGPTDGEFVEIYNPTAVTVDLSTYYLADHSGYHKVTSTPTPATADFVVRFPPGSKLAPGAFAIVSVRSATAFKGVFNVAPTYDFDANDPGAPTMIGTIGSSAGITDAGEMMVLFRWDGVSTTVADVDYVVWGSSTDKIDKSAVVGYLADTPPANQVAAPAPTSPKTLNRCPTSEDGEKTVGGNGILGHDETSESSLTSWKSAAASPGAAPASGVCP